MPVGWTPGTPLVTFSEVTSGVASALSFNYGISGVTFAIALAGAAVTIALALFVWRIIRGVF